MAGDTLNHEQVELADTAGLRDRVMPELVVVERARRKANVTARILVGSSLVSPDEIVALSEIADMLGVTRRTVQRYMDRDDFPAPLGVLAGGRRVWRRDDVAEWGRQTLPLSEGRPARKP